MIIKDPQRRKTKENIVFLKFLSPLIIIWKFQNNSYLAYAANDLGIILHVHDSSQDHYLWLFKS